MLHGGGGAADTEMAFSSALQRWRQNGLGWSQNRTSFSLPLSHRRQEIIARKEPPFFAAAIVRAASPPYKKGFSIDSK